MRILSFRCSEDELIDDVGVDVPFVAVFDVLDMLRQCDFLIAENNGL